MKKVLMTFAVVMTVFFGVIGCSSATTAATTANTSGTATTTGGSQTTTAATTAPAGPPIEIWVGQESADFYQTMMDDFVTNYPSTHGGSAFPYTVNVTGADTASAAAIFLDDTAAGPDILTVAHDNLGKLIAGSSAIYPITNQDLLNQIQNDNPAMFLDVIKGTVNDTEYTFGVPYIAQSLVLYYNTKYITPEQAQTWEGILEAARTANKQALSLAGTDGYNNSFILLSQRESDHYSSLELYKDGGQDNCYALGDDTIAKMKWGQRFFTDPNGAKRPSDSGWAVELKDEISISFIGGAWHFNAAQASLGENFAVTVLPSFTLTAADAYGTATAGTVYRSGTFVDTKMFVMKKEGDVTKQDYLQEILLYLSSKQVQEQSFAECQNLPAYKNAQSEFSEFQQDTPAINLANAELSMFDWGIPQPFGYQSKYNTYYYSKGAPDLFMDIYENKDNAFSSDAAIIAQLTSIQSIWTTGVPTA